MRWRLIIFCLMLSVRASRGDDATAPIGPAGAKGTTGTKGAAPAHAPDRFTFVRIEYDSYGGYGEGYYDYEGRRWQRWETDYPEAEENFLLRLGELTTIDPEPHPVHRRLSDPDLCRFPIIYMSDVGWQEMTEREIAGLRQYLERGGFLWVDDFWGFAEWDNFAELMKKVLPGAAPRDIPTDHPVMKIVFSLDECPQVPARDFAIQGWKWDPAWIHKMPTSPPNDMLTEGVEKVNFRGWSDDRGRLMVVCTHNTDMGDGWEREGIDEWYFKTYSTRAYAMSINIVVYALSH